MKKAKVINDSLLANIFSIHEPKTWFWQNAILTIMLLLISIHAFEFMAERQLSSTVISHVLTSNLMPLTTIALITSHSTSVMRYIARRN